MITTLHDRFGDELISPQQQQLLQNLKNHIHAVDEKDPLDPDFQDSLNLLLEEVESGHPKAAEILREVIKILNNMGI